MKTAYWDAIRNRRTYYGLSKEAVTTVQRIEEIVSEAVKHVPSSFNSQSARVAILLGEQHERLWEITKGELQKIVPPESFPTTVDKIDGAFRSGYGTILYFEDTSTVEGLQQRFPAYRENFPVWSQQSSGMLQFAIWSALEAEGWGASLQHYNPVIDAAVQAAWKIPASWKLIAQMPFGKPAAEPAPKEYQPLDERVKIYR
ncbi:nitroreductase family protein [Geomesophilobacter sediminis]|uniref:Nitroreductase family protein n=1 Tax=Geomesophilobacter sediminis TaxID=2798584 RepID=A0A8J7LYL6_9BACT|nr:nitroreductase family protein [Geomesophilobacter sediminis]MBJ6725047.1 nitroreductase family protein [Geomesophilobacter sediminis]